MVDSLKTIVAQGVTTEQANVFETATWLYIAIAETIIILLLLIFYRRRKLTLVDITIKESVKGVNPKGFGDVLGDAFKIKEAEILYDKLKKVCHPDRFPNDSDKIYIATQLAAKINENSKLYSKLIELQKEVEDKLNIKIK